MILAHLFQLVKYLCKIFRQGRKYHDGSAVPGMGKAQSSGVEHLAVLPQLRLLVAVDHITQNGVADVSHVDTDLMGAAGFQLAAHMGVTTVSADHFPMGLLPWNCGA